MQINPRHKLTPCQQEINGLVLGRLALSEPTIIVINSAPGSGPSTMMAELTEIISPRCLSIKSRPAVSDFNLLEAFYYHLGLGGEDISHRSPIPAFIAPLIQLQAFTALCIEDIDDFAITNHMKNITLGHLSKIASAVPCMSFVISQTLSRSDIDSSIHHREIVGPQERNEYFLHSFTGLQQYLEHFQEVIPSLGLRNISDETLTKLYGITEGNLALTMLHLSHPLLSKEWK